MNLNETKKSKETLLANKIQELQGLENARNNLSADILELRGQIKLIDEMLTETIEPVKPNENPETSIKRGFDAGKEPIESEKPKEKIQISE